MIEEKNAIIRETFLGREDHTIPTFILTLDYGGSRQGAGNIDFGKDVNVFDFLIKILETVGVDCWENLPRTHIRVRADKVKVHEIGHIIDNKWLKLFPEEESDG